MTKIPLICVVANYFGEYENQIEVSLNVLVKINNYIKVEFLKKGKYVDIDMCRDSISDVYSSIYFSSNHKNNSIKFNNSKIHDFYMDLYSIYNTLIDKEIRYDFLIIFEKYGKNDAEYIRNIRKLKLDKIKNL